MPEPTSTGTATMVLTAAAVPALQILGINTGLRSDELLAGFAGAVAAMGLLDSVPSTGDTAREWLKTSSRRVGVAIGSSVVAGYLVPLVSLFAAVPQAASLALSFVIGASAQRMLKAVVDRAISKVQGDA